MVLRFIALYHLFQALLMVLTLYVGGYTIRTDSSGFYSSISPVYFQLFAGLFLFIISKNSLRMRNTNTKKEILYLRYFIIIWVFSNTLKLIQLDFFLINVLWLYLMPSLYFLFKIKNKKIIYFVITTTVIGFVLYTLQGARGYALFPIALIFLNPAYQYLKSKTRIKRITIIITAIISLISYLTIIDIYRFTKGRETIDSSALFDFLSNDDIFERNNVQLLSNTVSWDRLLNHSMNYLLLEKHKLRGSQYLLEDSFTIISREKSNYKNVNYGHWTSAEYDFTATGTSSVEWSILSDWSSRYGPYVGLLLTLISYLFINLLISFNSKNILFQFMLNFQFLSSFFVFNFFETLHFILIAFILNYIIKFIYDIKLFGSRNISRR